MAAVAEPQSVVSLTVMVICRSVGLAADEPVTSARHETIDGSHSKLFSMDVLFLLMTKRRPSPNLALEQLGKEKASSSSPSPALNCQGPHVPFPLSRRH